MKIITREWNGPVTGGGASPLGDPIEIDAAQIRESQLGDRSRTIETLDGYLVSYWALTPREQASIADFRSQRHKSVGLRNKARASLVHVEDDVRAAQAAIAAAKEQLAAAERRRQELIASALLLEHEADALDKHLTPLPNGLAIYELVEPPKVLRDVPAAYAGANGKRRR